MSALGSTSSPVSTHLARLAHWFVLVWGWQRAGVAFAAGAASALAMAPFHVWPILSATFPALVWLIDGAAAGRLGRTYSAAVIGWWFGFGYFLAGLYWVGIAFLVDANTFGWLMPFAVIGLPAGLALFFALGTAIASLLWTPGASRILALAAAMTIAEWLRGHVLSGFPWNTLGYSLTWPLALAQTASVVGLWGLTFLAVAIFASPVTLGDDRRDTPRPWLAPVLAAILLCAIAGYGTYRLAVTPVGHVEGVRLRIMQPNLQQDVKFNYGAKQQVMDRYTALSKQPGREGSGLEGVTHLIWPESAFPFILTREPDALAQIADLLPKGTILITGAARAVSPDTGGPLQAHNSIYAIDHDGSVLAIYDKVHLVPFGEFLPFQALLERAGLMQLTKVRGGFTPGDRRRPFKIAGAPPAVPLICYEIVFPGQIVPRGDSSGWMLNVTNDGWFGRSTGPYQHFQHAKVRAIEEGLPLVRAANTGISAVVDPLGRIIRALPLGGAGVIDSTLPQRLSTTIYTRLGNWPIILIVFGSILFCGRIRMRGR